MDQLADRVKSLLDWNKTMTVKGNTQVTERYYVVVIKAAIESLGGKVGSVAGSQQSVDIRDIMWPDGSKVNIEVKKKNSDNTFNLNDTFIKPDVWYMFLKVKIQHVDLIKGSVLIEQNSAGGSSRSVRDQLKVLAKIIGTGDEPFDRFTDLYKETLELMRIAVLNGLFSFFDYGQMFKRTTKFGNLTSRPRPNWKIYVPTQ
jgi:hypothetical protein